MRTLPYILTVNTFKWTPAPTAASRRTNESRHMKEVFDFFTSLGFDVNLVEEYPEINARKDDMYIRFSYYESINYVSKTLLVFKNGKKSNIRAIKNLL